MIIFIVYPNNELSENFCRIATKRTLLQGQWNGLADKSTQCQAWWSKSLPQPTWQKKTDPWKLSSDLHSHGMHVYVHTHTINNKQTNRENVSSCSSSSFGFAEFYSMAVTISRLHRSNADLGICFCQGLGIYFGFLSQCYPGAYVVKQELHEIYYVLISFTH